MLTRRQAILATLGLSAGRQGSAAITPVNFDVPENACDCHTHIFGQQDRFPMAPERAYTPEPALPEDMSALHRAIHMDRVVIVTPSVYGTDNSATLWGMKARGAAARGIAVIGFKAAERDLDAMDKAGVRGIRLNLAGVTNVDSARSAVRSTVSRLRDRGWRLQVYAALPVVAGLKDVVLDSPVPVVFDHFGGAQAALGVDQPGFADLLEMVQAGKAYVKISGAYRASKLSPDFSDVAPLAKALIAARPDRLVWGTDWPHPNPPFPIDDGLLLNLLPTWAPDPEIRKQILVTNPARLYGF